MLIRLEDYKCVSWNTLYAGKHWTVRQEMANYAHQSVQVALLKLKKIPHFKKRVTITVTAYLKRPVDPDNVCSKLVIDGLKGKVIDDDTWKDVLSVTTKSIKSNKEFTEILIK